MTPDDPTDGKETPSSQGVAELVQSLAAVMHQSNVTELDVQLGTVTIRLRRPWHEPPGAESPLVLPQTPGARLPAATHTITAPMIGTFYASQTPGTPPYVAEGDEVYAGQTIGIIEAMKIMNEITADRSGVVETILVTNGQPVEYGSPLMHLSASREAR